MTDDTWKTALEDARQRHAAVVGLIYFIDSQAMALLRLYVTLAIAAAAGAATAFTTGSPIPPAAGWGLAVATVVLGAGSAFCLRAMRAVTIYLPGRGAEFWLWAKQHDIDGGDVAKAYLENLRDKQAQNNSVNDSTSRALEVARLCGAAAPIVALAVSAAVLAYDRSGSVSVPTDSRLSCCPSRAGETAGP